MKISDDAKLRPEQRRINIGCGYDKRPDYLNVDVDPACAPDYLVKDHDLSVFADGHFEEVLAWDVLEHIPHAFTMHAILDWSALLRPGGKLVLQTSSVYGVIDVMRTNPTFETEYNWMRCLFGNQQHLGDFHHYGFTNRTLSTFLRAAGLEPGTISLADGWLLQCECTKRFDWAALVDLPLDRAVALAFESVLRRSIDEDKLNFYRQMHDSGQSVRSLVKDIIASPEHMYKIGQEDGFDPWPAACRPAL